MARVGGKKLLKKQIVDTFFPKGYTNMTYVEPFVGGGSVYFYKEPSEHEVINDKDSIVIELFKGFKKFDGNQISHDINGIYSKGIFDNIMAMHPRSDYNKFIRNLILIKTSFYGKGKSYGNGGHGDKISSNYDRKYNERLKNTIILNQDYKTVIQKYDSPNTFFYLDPPYENSEKMYTHDTVHLDELFDILNHIKGSFLMSYNNSAHAKELFRGYKIRLLNTKYTGGTQGSQLNKVKELLISNY